MTGAWSPDGNVDVEDMLNALDIDNVRLEGLHEARFSCPYPNHENGDRTASAYMNLETTLWTCHGCGKKGNAISFAASILDISPMKATRLLRQAYDPSSLNPDDRRMVDELRSLWAGKRKPKEHDNEPFDDDLITQFSIDWDAVVAADEEDVPDEFLYILQRGFTAKTLKEWDFGYDERTRRVTFVVRDEHGRAVGVKGRATDGRHPKYLMIGDGPDQEPRYGFPRFSAGRVVFGLDKAIVANGSDVEKELIICEGELNAIALRQMGYMSAVALNGSKLTSHQAKLIRRHADRATFFFDMDKAGQSGVWGWDDEKGEHHPGALEVLSRDLALKIVGPFEMDAADALANHEEDAVHELLESATPYLAAALARR